MAFLCVLGVPVSEVTQDDQTNIVVPWWQTQRAFIALTLFAISVCAVLPLIVSGSWIYALGVCFANCIGVLAVSLLVRYGGEVTIGHVFFVAAGAYTVAILEDKMGISILVSVPLAVVVATVLGIGFAWPSRRISGIYLAVSTMALALALPELINNASELTGGYEGLYVSLDLIPGFSKPLQHYYVPLIMLIATTYALQRLRKSRQGMALLVARSHPVAAEAFGITGVWARISVMAISAGIAGLSGAMLAYASSTVSPSGLTLWTSIFLLVGSVVSLYGLTFVHALVGGVFITLIPQVLASSGAWIPVMYGTALLAVILAGHYAPKLRGLWNKGVKI